MKQLGVTHWIPESNIFVSGDLGVSKPNINAFQHVENALNLEKDQTIYIGDAYENDVVGAKQAGWHVIWMNHRQRAIPEHGVHPDASIDHPNDLYSAILQQFSLNQV
ncbi:HAD family hydrolase [Gracilibacillus halophilus]|nr:HAD-IA family hydrolase [Gracilibacillus halophilus]